MAGSDTQDRSVLIWVCEGTWRASVDAALSLAPAGARFTLLHVTSAEVADAAHGAYLGLFGRGRGLGRDPGARLDELATASAGDLLATSGGQARARAAKKSKFTDIPNERWWQRQPKRICWSWRETATGPGSGRRAWARPHGSSSITPPAPFCWSGPSLRLTSPPSPRHRTIPRRHIVPRHRTRAARASRRRGWPAGGGGRPGRSARAAASPRRRVQRDARRDDLVDPVEDVVVQHHVRARQQVGELVHRARADDRRGHGRDARSRRPAPCGSASSPRRRRS